jgi:hypothetical protein
VEKRNEGMYPEVFFALMDGSILAERETGVLEFW